MKTIERPRIMVVEDTYLVAKDIQETLQALGYQVPTVAATGREAMESIYNAQPDLILMDIKLKGDMDGIETASLIHEDYDIPIIYLTGLGDDYTILRARRTEASGYIIKPFNKEDLHSSIEMALYKYKMENFIKDREEFLSTTLQSINYGVITTDKEGFITFINTIAEKLIELSQDETLGKPVNSVLNVINENQEDVNPYSFEQVLKYGKRVESRNQIFKTRSGKAIPIVYISEPIIDNKGRITGSVITLHDVTEQKKLQMELEKAQKSELIAQRARSLGHEFNNLLTVIRGSIELLKQTIDDSSGSYSMLIDAEKASKKASDLTNQFLAFARSDKPVKRPESIVEILSSTANSILSDSSVILEKVIQPQLWHVDIDISQISQVLYIVIRIIYNIIEENGKIRITAENLAITEKDMLPVKPGNYVKILIKGFGAIIPGDIFKQMFDPYFKNADYNEGLELSTAYTIIKNHSGYITVESGIDMGTAFYLYLPGSGTIIAEQQPPRQKSKSTSQRRILVMDDQELVRIIAGKMLNFMGFVVDFARHGAEAVEIYSQAAYNNERFDCVILDLTIPWGLGAKETITRLYEIDPEVRAIVSTGYSNDPALYNYKELGFKGVIKKPYELQELSNVLQDTLE